MSERLAKILTYVFQPIIVSFYGLGLLLFFPYFYGNAPEVKYVLLCIAFVFIVAIPAIAYAILRATGVIKTSQASARSERVWAYGITIFSYIILYYAFSWVGVAQFFVNALGGTIVNLVLITIINFWWKISAHATGIAAITGACFYINYVVGVNYWPLYIVLFLIAGLICSARLRLNAHTPAQLLAGYILGVFCTGFLPFLIF